MLKASTMNSQVYHPTAIGKSILNVYYIEISCFDVELEVSKQSLYDVLALVQGVHYDHCESG